MHTGDFCQISRTSGYFWHTADLASVWILHTTCYILAKSLHTDAFSITQQWLVRQRGEAELMLVSLLALQVNSYCGLTKRRLIPTDWRHTCDTLWISGKWGPKTHLQLPLITKGVAKDNERDLRDCYFKLHHNNSITASKALLPLRCLYGLHYCLNPKQLEY